MTDIVTEVIDEGVAEAEKLFPPKPGGMVTRFREEKAQREEAARERENQDEKVEQPAFKSVKVTSLSPEVIATNVVQVPAGGQATILPYSPYRARATISIDTAASKVILAKDSSAALGGTGFTYQTAMPPLIVTSRAQLTGFNPGGAAIAVSVLSEMYAPESM